MPAEERTKLAKGFIMNKMYTLGLMGWRHTSVDNLPKSCPRELEENVRAAIDELRREKLLVIKPRSHGQQASATVADLGRQYANAYRKHVNLPETDFNPTKEAEAPPMTGEELRKLKFKK
jgi:hypothetical protein